MYTVAAAALFAAACHDAGIQALTSRYSIAAAAAAALNALML
jgi:hypothetical protein